MANLIGSREAARILGIDRSGLIRRVRSGAITPVSKLESATGAYVFERAAIEALAGGAS